jgi:hypothetical protein
MGAVSSPSSDDAWAVGSYGAPGGGTKDLALHWNGTSWTRTPVPSPGTAPVDDALTGVSAQSADNVWAVGDTVSSVLIVHWNGTAWSQTSFPLPSGFAGGHCPTWTRCHPPTPGPSARSARASGIH